MLTRPLTSRAAGANFAKQEDVMKTFDLQAEDDLYAFLAEEEGPTEIEAAVVRLLTGVGHESRDAIRRVAGEISVVIAEEHEDRELDMVYAITRLDALLSPLCDWLVRETTP
jgi:hypothetical protein